MSEFIPAAQLLYTNVEADLSPTGRRGFQIWLCTPSLAEPQRLEVAKRLDDYQLPDAAADPASLTRHVFFRLGDGHFVVARSVPLKKTDRFGRGGRFFAHALVFAAADFERAAADPFRVIDGPFHFFADPDEVLAAGVDWHAGTLPEARVELATTSVAPASEVTRAVFADLVAWLPLGEGRTVAVAEKPSAVLDVLRDLFRFLPPPLRRDASFDTLSTGEHLGRLPYRFAGSYSPVMLRCWVYRKYHRLELDPPRVHPPLERGPDSLAGALTVRWLTHPLADDQRSAAVRIAAALERSWPEGCAPGSLTDETAEILAGVEAFEAQVQRMIRARLDADLGPTLADAVRSHADEYFGTPSRGRLDRLTRPIPEDAIALWLLDAITPMRPPPASLLAALAEWLRGRSSPAVRPLVMIASRWMPSQVGRLADSLRRVDQETELMRWFRAWSLDTMADVWNTDAGLRSVARDLAHGELDGSLAPEVNLFLALHTHDDRPIVRELRFWSAVADRDTETMTEAIQDEHLYEQLYGDWLAEVSVVPRWACYALPGELALFLGYDLVPEAGEGPRVVPVLRLLADTDKRRFFDTWFLFASPPDEANMLIAQPEPSQLPHARERMNRYDTEERFGRITEMLPKVDDRTFAALMNEYVVDRVMAVPEKVYISDDRFWVGLRVRMMEPKRRDFDLVCAALASLLPMRKLDTTDDEEFAPPANEHRLRWMMARMRHPRTTARLRLTRDGW